MDQCSVSSCAAPLAAAIKFGIIHARALSRVPLVHVTEPIHRKVKKGLSEKKKKEKKKRSRSLKSGAVLARKQPLGNLK